MQSIVFFFSLQFKFLHKRSVFTLIRSKNTLAIVSMRYILVLGRSFVHVYTYGRTLRDFIALRMQKKIVLISPRPPMVLVFLRFVK